MKTGFTDCEKFGPPAEWVDLDNRRALIYAKRHVFLPVLRRLGEALRPFKSDPEVVRVRSILATHMWALKRGLCEMTGVIAVTRTGGELRRRLELHADIYYKDSGRQLGEGGWFRP